MNTITKHERPGVYSAYEISSAISRHPGGAVVGLIAVSEKGGSGKLTMLYDIAETVAEFGADTPMTRLAIVCLQNGASAVAAVPVRNAEAYADACDLLNENETVKLVICDSTELSVQKTLREKMETAAQLRRERIAVVCGGASEAVSDFIERATQLNSERVVLVAPETTGTGLTGPLLAAAVAGAIAGESDPAVPLSGATLQGIEGLSARYTESMLDALIRGGVTVVEEMGGEITVVRGITTRTKTRDVDDTTWQELTTVRIVDYVIPIIRRSLASKFARAKNTAQVRGAIRSQVILELEELCAREIVTGYEAVTVSALEDNPTVCRVDFSFRVTHGLNQIWLCANITV